MNYIDQAEYSKLVQNFGKQASKEVLKEGYVDLKPINLQEFDSEEDAKKAVSLKEKKKLHGGQGEIAAAAPPEDEITGADFLALKAKKAAKKEGIHLGEPTGPTITTVESKHNFKQLSVEERKQLKEYIGSLKEIKKAIKELVGKASMQERDNTNLVLAQEADAASFHNSPIGSGMSAFNDPIEHILAGYIHDEVDMIPDLAAEIRSKGLMALDDINLSDKDKQEIMRILASEKGVEKDYEQHQTLKDLGYGGMFE